MSRTALGRLTAPLALTLVLLSGAGLMIRTFESIRMAEPGFTEPQHLQIMRIFVAGAFAANPEQTTRVENDIQDALAAIGAAPRAAFRRLLDRRASGGARSYRTLPFTRTSQARR